MQAMGIGSVAIRTWPGCCERPIRPSIWSKRLKAEVDLPGVYHSRDTAGMGSDVSAQRRLRPVLIILYASPASWGTSHQSGHRVDGCCA
jgi:hypothetical protein